MKTILFDHQIFESQEYGGISKVFCNRIPYMKQYFNCVISVKATKNQPLLSSGIVDCKKTLKNVSWGPLNNCHFPLKRTITSILSHSIQNKISSIRHLKKSDFELFEPTYYDPYFLNYLEEKPFVIEIHDMIPEILPQYYNDGMLIQNKRLLIERAAHIHTPSQHTKDDIVALYGTDSNKITVVPHGVPEMPHNDDSPIFDFPYLLYVGARWDYKNFTPFLKEFANVSSDFPDIHLVCTGKPFSDREDKTIQELYIDNKVHQISPSNNQFHSLYHNSVAFVFPSLYEGFGLPILEAWSCGCPVMLNNTSCFPELAGDAALYFELNEKQNNFYDRFKQLWQMSSEDRNSLINSGYERMKLFSWEKSAKKLSEVYNRITS